MKLQVVKLLCINIRQTDCIILLKILNAGNENRLTYTYLSIIMLSVAGYMGKYFPSLILFIDTLGEGIMKSDKEV